MNEPALGLVESSSIARGIVVSDAIVKKAEVRIVRSEAVTPGKYLVLIAGGEAEVDAALAAGIAAAGETLIDRLYLPNVHPFVLQGIDGKIGKTAVDSLGIVEAATVAATLLAADAACKAADVRLVEMQLAKGIGGKGYFALSGSLTSIEASVDAAQAAIDPKHLVGREILAAPHAEIHPTLRRGV